MLASHGGFKVTERSGRLLIDSRSYGRPLRGRGRLDRSGRRGRALPPSSRASRKRTAILALAWFDRTLELAIVALLKTPAVADPIAVRPEGGTGYAFTDPALEALTPAQKQLLRTGRANVQAIQIWLRSVALALGIPAERLPA
jgi:hypothetical protein